MLRFFIVVAVLVVGGVAVYKPATDYIKERNKPEFRTVEVEEGSIKSVVNATGEVKPVRSYQVGSVVSGPIEEIYVDFNEEVAEGQLLAKIDERLFVASVRRDQAALITREADLRRADALHKQAINDEKRAVKLREENENFISDAEMDKVRFTRMSQEAQVQVAKASIDQAKANLENSEANLSFTNIVAPVAGIIIDRKIDPGQSLAATFQAPELFVVAPRMREKMHIFASVDEADIGLIRKAWESGETVQFTVDAYPEDLFEGEIEEIRFSSTKTQNVVTYPVVVAAANPDLKLLPGMTASISFQVEKTDEAIKIPNSALRYYPDIKLVREEDQELLEGKDWEDQDDSAQDRVLSAEEKAAARKKRNTRHVWVVENDKLKAVEIVTGISDSRFTELKSGGLEPGAELVTGLEPKKSSFGR